ncbi:hypothetical protein CHU98_g6983 [Xylaria longipes]|nr:hypothetical protein CHU98_g6983 [Xylaria longipes]
MNAIGLGADMVAFIVLASQLSKVLYTTFSSIKDGPSNARRVSSHLLQLHEVLEQLRHYPLARHDTELTRHVESCIADLESLFNSAQKFHTRIANQSINDLSYTVEEQTEILATKFGDFSSTFHSHHEKLQNELDSLHIAVDDMSSVSQKTAGTIIDLLTEMKNSIVNHNRGAFQKKKMMHRTRYPVRLNGTLDESVEATDISGSDVFGEPAEPAFIDSMGEDRALWGNSSRRDWPGLEVTEAIDLHHA